jgi:hypothetical protein
MLIFDYSLKAQTIRLSFRPKEFRGFVIPTEGRNLLLAGSIGAPTKADSSRLRRSE